MVLLGLEPSNSMSFFYYSFSMVFELQEEKIIKNDYKRYKINY